MKKAFFAFLLLIPAVAYVAAQGAAPTPSVTTTAAGNIPAIVVDGFRTFQNGGYSGAVGVWTRYSTMSLDTQAYQQVLNTLAAQSNLAGAFLGAEVVRIVNLSTSVEEVYVVVKYQTGLMFMGFTCYKLPDKWIITTITLDKDPAKVLPTNILGGL